MSTKITIIFTTSKNFYFHLYYCYVMGFELAVRVGNMNRAFVQSLTEKEAKEIFNNCDKHNYWRK